MHQHDASASRFAREARKFSRSVSGYFADIKSGKIIPIKEKLF